MPQSKNASRKNDVADVPADNPVGAMDRFTDGLRRVLAAPKERITTHQRRRKRKRQR